MYTVGQSTRFDRLVEAVDMTQFFAADGLISDNEKGDLVNAAAQSSCGY